MVKLKTLIFENVGEEAKKRGLHHIGWGRYADRSGNLVAKSVDGKLVDIPRGELDPEVDQPAGHIEDLPKEKRPLPWQNWKPKSSADDSDLRQYRTAGRAAGGMMGSSWETRWRSLPPGDVAYDRKSNNQYVARNPDGKLASFSDDVIAAAFASGKQLKGYDFDKDYYGSMKKLSTELKPLLDKLKSNATSVTRKQEIKDILRDIVTAFIDGASRRKSDSKRTNGKFGGGGGFSGGGGGISF